MKKILVVIYKGTTDEDIIDAFGGPLSVSKLVDIKFVDGCECKGESL